MPEPFSLVRQAWIPVALDDGRRVYVRPCDISEPFEGQTILRVATGRPDCDISLTEFLIGLLAISMDGLSNRQWPKRFRTPPSRAELEKAFALLEKAMILDGDNPRFFQDYEPLNGEPGPISGLLIDAPGASTLKDNADHFVKRGHTTFLSRTGAAIVLLTLQTQAPSGGAGHRTSLRGGGPLTTLVLPTLPGNAEPSLWQRLWANTPDGLKDGANDLERVFPWLVPTRVSDKSGRPTTPNDVHEAQAFFSMPRRIRLIFEPNTERRACDLTGQIDDVIVTSYVTKPWGTNYMAWSKGHPLSPYYKTKKNELEYLPLHLQSSRVGYRQYIGMGLESQDGLGLPAACVSTFRTRAGNLEDDDSQTLTRYRMLVCGYAMDNMKPLDFAEALVPLILTGNEDRDNDVADIARCFVKSAELSERQLILSVKRALFGERGEAKRDSAVLAPVSSRFWADTEQPFYICLRAAAEALIAASKNIGDTKKEAREAWRTVLWQHALEIFDDTVPIENAQASRIADIVTGRKSLGLALDGYSATGKKLFALLGLTLPEKSKSKKRRKQQNDD